MAITTIQPAATYVAATSRPGASIQTSLNTAPAAAADHATIRMTRPKAPCRTSSAKGV